MPTEGEDKGVIWLRWIKEFDTHILAWSVAFDEKLFKGYDCAEPAKNETKGSWSKGELFIHNKCTTAEEVKP